MNVESEYKVEQRVSGKGRHSWRMTEEGRSLAAREWEDLRLRAGGNDSSWMTLRNEVDGYFKDLGEKSLNESEKRYTGLLKRSMETRLRSMERREFLEEIKANVSGWEDVATDSKENFLGAFSLRRKVRKAVVDLCKSENRPVSDMWELAMSSEFELREERDKKQFGEIPNMAYEECQRFVKENADKIWNQEFTPLEIEILPVVKKGKLQTLIENKKAETAAAIVAVLTFTAASLSPKIDSIRSSLELWWKSLQQENSNNMSLPTNADLPITKNLIKKEEVITSTPTAVADTGINRKDTEKAKVTEVVKEPERNYFVGQMDLKKTINWKFPWNEEAFDSLQLVDKTSDFTSSEVIEIFNKWSEYPNAVMVYPTDGDAEVIVVHSSAVDTIKLPADGVKDGDWVGKNVTGFQNIDEVVLATEFKILKQTTITLDEFIKMSAIAKNGEEGYFRLDKLGIENGEADLIMVTCEGKKMPDGDYDQRILVYMKMVDQKVEIKKNPINNSTTAKLETTETLVKEESPTASQELEELINEFALTYSPESGVTLGKYIEKNWYVYNKWNYGEAQKKRIESALRLLDSQTYGYGHKGKEQAIQCVGWASLVAAVEGSTQLVSGMGNYQSVGELVPGDVHINRGEWKSTTNKFGVDFLLIFQHI